MLMRIPATLVLTLIGGGCFNNPLFLILECLVSAHVNLSKNTSLSEVILPLFDIKVNAEQIRDRLIHAGCPKEFITIEMK